MLAPLNVTSSRLPVCVVPVKPASGEKVLGGHAVLAVGYDDSKRCFIIRNSWGGDWGIKGYFWMPYAYLQDKHLAADFWTLRSVKESK